MMLRSYYKKDYAPKMYSRLFFELNILCVYGIKMSILDPTWTCFL